MDLVSEINVYIIILLLYYNTFDYNHSIYRDYILGTVTASDHIKP